MKHVDYYQLLGVERNVDSAALKRAYRKLARKYHPDVSEEPDAEAQFKAIAEAYDVLKDPEKRKVYDQFGETEQRQGHAPQQGWDTDDQTSGYTRNNFDFSQFADFFEDNLAKANADTHATLNITLEELVAGEPVDLYVNDRLGGDARHLRVDVPSHLREGQVFRLKKQGRLVHANGARGDLYVELRIVPHPDYEVRGNHVYTKILVTPWEAVLGSKIRVDTLHGPVSLSIPAGSTAGSSLRLKGRGLAGNPAGHQYVELVIDVPSSLTSEELEHYKALADASSFNPREQNGVPR